MIKPIKFEVELADYDSVREHIHLTQYDRGFNIEISILEHGLPYTLQNDEAIQIDFELPENSGYILSKESINIIDSNTISFAVNRNITLNFGIAKFNIAIVDKSTGITKKKSTNQYTVDIAPNALSEDFVSKELIVSAKEELDESILTATEIIESGEATIQAIKNTGNKSFIVNKTDWTSTTNGYKYILTHNLQSVNLHVSMIDLTDNMAYLSQYKIIDVNKIEVYAIEQIKANIVISAKYYNGLGDNVGDKIVQEVVDARCGMTSLGDKIRDMDSQLTSNVNKINTSLEEKANKTDITTTKTELEKLISDTALATKKALHPVNSIYLSMDSTNPNTLFGFGTWQLIGQGRTLVGVDTSDNDFKTVNKAGGSKTHNHNSGTLVADIGAVDSNLGAIGYNATGATKNNYNRGITGSAIGDIDSKKANHATTVSGTTDSTSSLPPYITCYIWKRTA